MTVKRQHLVWRKYLAPWTDSPDTTEGNIFCYDVSKKEIRLDSVENVGVQNYAYDISTINDADKQLVTQYYANWLEQQCGGLKITVGLLDPNHFKEKDYIENNFISPIEIQGLPMLTGLYNKVFPFDGPTEAECISKELEKLFIESLSGNPDESKLNALINRSQELRKNLPRDLRFEFYEYLAVQMMRTWKTKNTILDAVQDTIKHFSETAFKDSTKAVFPLMMIVNSEILANSLCKQDFYIELIENKSQRRFLTCDLPVINLFANYKEKEEVSKLYIYYPLTPYMAIVCKNTINSNLITTIEDEKTVDEYNTKMINAAEKQVYAKCKEDLEIYLK